jgi:hypothetical protein
MGHHLVFPRQRALDGKVASLTHRREEEGSGVAKRKIANAGYEDKIRIEIVKKKRENGL